tara:strand:- start:989 stop:1327 length:339 start_codon:yes stop_codon:yes gene_type:complete
MHITVSNEYQFEQAFRQYGRDNQFSYKGLRLLFEYLEEIDPKYELDVIALCCEYSEETPEDIARNYLIDLNDADPESDDYAEQCAAIVRDYLQDHTSIVGETSTGAIVYAQF